MMFESRPPALPVDMPLIVDLSARAEVVDQTDFASSAPALEGALARPGVDLQRDLRLWFDAAGQPLAFALLDRRQDDQQIDALLWMRVLPERRAPELDRTLIGWGAERLRQVGAECGLPTRLAVGVGGADHQRLALLVEQNFSPLRYFLRMERPIDGPLAPPQLPAGFTLRAVAGDHEAEAWAELFNLSFVDHWNFHPLSAERLRGIWQEPLYNRELDLVLVAPDGVLAAFCACERDPDDPERAAWIEALGTRRGYRGLGLGRAVLLAGLAALQGAGAQVARLTVDAESPTGATRLYESAGFRETRRSVRMARPLEPPGPRAGAV